MQPAAAASVHAQFDGVPRPFASLPVRPRRDARGPAFELAAAAETTLVPSFVLGHVQVEQFLVPGDGGRLQALPVAYDPVAGDWFDVFPEAPDARAWEHWTRPGMTANSQCVECHTTGYEKGYDVATDTYATHWAEAGVGCEACHGPGGDHVARRRVWGVVDRWERERLCSAHYISRWRALLAGPAERVARSLVEPGEWKDALFQNTPWTFALERPAA
jgi:hypothetical protein